MKARSAAAPAIGSAPPPCYFNMIEVVLGLGLIAFGLITTVGLLPVGLSASRNAIAQTMPADSADQFLHFYAIRLGSPAADYENWDQLVAQLRYASSPAQEPTNWQEWFTEPPRPPEFAPPPTDPQQADPWREWTTRFCRSPTDPGTYFKVEQKAGGATAVDFEAVYKVGYRHFNTATGSWRLTSEWRVALESAYTNAHSRAGSGNTIREVIAALEAKTNPTQDDLDALALLKSIYLAPLDIRIEVSWPGAIPYAQRNKALFNLEVYRSR